MLNIDKRIEELELWGCDIKNALERMVDDEQFYINCLISVVNDKCFDNLGAALESGNIEVAFDNAHTLKGVLSSVGLTPMYNVILKIVEPLRQGNTDNLESYFEELIRQKNYLFDILNS